MVWKHATSFDAQFTTVCTLISTPQTTSLTLRLPSPLFPSLQNAASTIDFFFNLFDLVLAKSVSSTSSCTSAQHPHQHFSCPHIAHTSPKSPKDHISSPDSVSNIRREAAVVHTLLALAVMRCVACQDALEISHFGLLIEECGTLRFRVDEFRHKI
jgi:hypothetical protein